jgi:hypothetical protein
MTKKNQHLTRNPKTRQQWEELQHKQRIFEEIQASGALTPKALKRKKDELTQEGEAIVQALFEDNKRGELTQLGARVVAEAADKASEATEGDDRATSSSYYAAGNRVKSIKVTGVRHKEIDTEQLAMIYWLQAKRIVKERRQKEEARLQREQVKIEFDADHQPAPKKPAPPKPSSKEVAKLKRQLEETRERLRQLGVNPDAESPQQPESDRPDPPAPSDASPTRPGL